MNFTATQAKVYDIQVEGKSIGEFKVASEWEGFAKLVMVKDPTQVLYARIESDAFTEIFSTDPHKPKNVHMVACPPSLLPAAKPTPEQEALTILLEGISAVISHGGSIDGMRRRLEQYRNDAKELLIVNDLKLGIR